MRQIGRYEIERELGQGGMGVVYLGHDPAIDRPVAIKTLRPDAEVPPKVMEQYRQRFVREAKAAGRLAHPGIVAVYDAGRDPESGLAYIAMEYVPGRSLEETLEQQGKLPLERALRLCKQVAQALAYAHGMGVVHRDIKPANIMLPEEGLAKLADFGVARLEDSQLTRTGQIIGSPQTMAPEQVAGADVDARADLFALGAVLYQMVTGEPPFQAQNLTTLFYQILNVDPVPPAVANPALPNGLDAVVMRLLAKRPEDRYPSAEDVIADLEILEAGGTPAAASGGHPDTLVASASPGPAGAMERTRVSAPAAPETLPLGGAAPAVPRSTLLLGGLAAIAVIAAALVGYVIASRGEPTDGGAPAAEAAPAPNGVTADPSPMAVTATPTPTGVSTGSAPTPVAPAPVGTATLVIDFEHHIEQGSYRVLHNGELLHEGRLHATKKSRRFLPKLKLAHQIIREELAVPAGGARIEVRVSSPQKELQTSKSIEAVFDAEDVRVLEIRVQRVTNNLSLQWRPGRASR